jgi:hypothetical protein
VATAILHRRRSIQPYWYVAARLVPMPYTAEKFRVAEMPRNPFERSA